MIDEKKTFFREYLCLENEALSVVIEDDGRVAYGYLCDRREIVSDVWLYNRVVTPETTEWSDPSLLPFLNPVEFVTPNEYGPIQSESDVSVSWGGEVAHISLHQVHWAVLRRGEKTGECLLVKKDGPLGRVMRSV